MPSKPLKPCAHVGCAALTNKTYCDQHLASRHNEKKSAAKRYDQTRGTRTERGYDSKWYQYRKMFLAIHPWCKECLQHGRYTLARQVDHIIPHRGDPKLFWDVENHQGLCDSCHSRKTAIEDGGFGRSPRRKKV